VSAAAKTGTAAPLLRAHGLVRSYDGFLALTSLSLEVEPGELVALVGPNGAGKTTFITIAAGLLEPSSGLLEVEGAPAGSLAARRAVSFLPDAPVFYEDLSLGEHLEYVGSLHGVKDGAGAERLLARLELTEWADSLPSDLSKGMRQKASIALALVRPFSVLLADEPFDGLDPVSRNVLFELLSEARAAGAAVIVSTHRPDVVAAASRCIAIREGRLAYDGPSDASEVGEFFAGEAFSQTPGSLPPA
jgi:ABC-type multidrug transport system ATPase subunit